MHQTITPQPTVAELQQRIADVRAHVERRIRERGAEERAVGYGDGQWFACRAVQYELLEVLHLLDAKDGA